MGLLEALGLKPKGSKVAIAAADAASAGSTSAPPPDPHQVTFTAARVALQKLVDTLKAHAMAARVAAPIIQAETRLMAADAHAGKKEWAEAGKRLAEARAVCIAAKKLADDWALYAVQRASALALAMSLDSADSSQGMGFATGRLNQADALAAAVPPNFAAALAKLREIVDGIKPALSGLIASVKARLASIESASAGVKTFLKTDIDQGKALITGADKALSSGQWSLTLQNAMAAMRLLGPAVRLAQRRSAFDSQRATTLAAIARLKVPAVSDRAAALTAEVTQADALAAHDVRKFEEAVRAMQSIATRAAMWFGLGACRTWGTSAAIWPQRSIFRRLFVP